MRHKLLNRDEINKTAWCVACDKQVEINFHKRTSGSSSWRCAPNYRAVSRNSSKPSNYKYRQFVKDKCESCRFIPVDICQLDVDHIDGDHSNNEVSNLQTLCANCHRLKTKLQKDGMYAR